MDKTYFVSDFGTLYEGEGITEEQKWCNTRAIQNALDTVGKNGGGTILLPEGTYYLNGHQEAGDIPGDENGLNTACIYIQYGNIELKGAGIDKTFLVTPSEFKIINNTVQRVHGIRVIPAKDTTIENLVFKDFDLYGGFHGTGNIHWPANTETGDGWDIMHKGFAFFNRGVYGCRL